MLSSAVIFKDSFPVCCTVTLPTDLLEIDENSLASLDSVLTIPEPLVPPNEREQPVNKLKVTKHVTK